jgi:Na+-translocating ferredoxin:NAD+ oxidoreductase subunit B
MAFFITDKCIGCAVCTKVCPVEAITGLRNKQHRVNPEICIDCGACGRICPHGAILDPDRIPCRRIRFRKHWPKPVINRETCISCKICMDACPTACFALDYTKDTRDTNGYPVLARPGRCIACGFCETDCPVTAIKMVAPEV